MAPGLWAGVSIRICTAIAPGHRPMVKTQNPRKAPLPILAVPQMDELRTLGALLSFAGEGMASGLHGTVAADGIDLQTAWDQSSADAVVSRAILEFPHALAIARTGFIVIELGVAGEQGSEPGRIAIDKCGVEQLAIHSGQFIVERPRPGGILCAGGRHREGKGQDCGSNPTNKIQQTHGTP